MQSQARTNQGGSVINFLIVGIVLVGLVVGGIYFANHRGQGAETEKTPPIAMSPSASPEQSSSSPQPSSSSSPSPTPSPRSSASPESVPTTGVLPTTGPADDLLLASLPFAVLLGMTISYVQSRRFRRRSPLN